MVGASYRVDEDPATLYVVYHFDAFGNRIERATFDAALDPLAVLRLGYDGWDTAKPVPVGNEHFEAWVDLDGSNALTGRRVYGAGFDEVVNGQNGAGGVVWHGTFRQGTVRHFFDNVTGTSLNSVYFDAFGQATHNVPLERHAYAGREWDADLGLYYYRARMYDPAVGRFYSEDPWRFAAGDVNLYRYVGNSPTNGTDPSGRWLVFGSREESQRTQRFLTTLGISSYSIAIQQNTFGRDEWALVLSPNDREKLEALARDRPELWSSEFARTETLRALGPDEHIWFSANNGRFYAGRVGDYPDVGDEEKKIYFEGKKQNEYIRSLPPTITPLAPIGGPLSPDELTRAINWYVLSFCWLPAPGPRPVGPITPYRPVPRPPVAQGPPLGPGANLPTRGHHFNQIASRGWTSQSISVTVSNPFTTRTAINRATGNPATVYYNRDGSYVVVDNITRDVIQISNRNDPHWIPDSTIVNPYRP